MVARVHDTRTPRLLQACRTAAVAGVVVVTAVVAGCGARGDAAAHAGDVDAIVAAAESNTLTPGAHVRVTAIVDAGDILDPHQIGRRLELAARVQGGGSRDGRLQLSMTSHGVQLEAEVRRPEHLDPAVLVGADVRVRGVIAAASPPHLVVAS